MAPELPELFTRRMAELLGNEWPRFLAHYEQPSPTGLRVNTLKISIKKFREISPFPLAPIPWVEEGFQVDGEVDRPGKHPYHAAGLYYVQDPAAMAAATMLDPRPGERVLDLAAAPGGKATHLASRMQGRGLLVASDPHPRRIIPLARNLERWGARNTVVLNEIPARLIAHFGPFFDKILVDAPCSGEGTFRKDPASRRDWSPEGVKDYARRQDRLLSEAAQLLRPGGRMVYATCTFSPEEDEGTLARFLEGHPEFSLETPPWFPGFEPGRPEWVQNHACPEASNAVRLWPHRSPGEGHFLARLRKNGRAPTPDRADPKPGVPRLPRRAADLFQTFCQENLSPEVFSAGKKIPGSAGDGIPVESLALLGDRIYALPAGCPFLKGLRVTHWGWWLGNIKEDRFEPAYSLAMGISSTQVKRTLPLPAASPEIWKYLAGESLRVEGEKGWVLITVDGFPVSWGKQVHNQIKNHTPKWLRWI